AGPAQPPERDRVAPGLAREVPAEAEHARPLREQPVRAVGALSADAALVVVRVGPGEAAARGEGAFGEPSAGADHALVVRARCGGIGAGALGRVLREIAGHLLGP